MTPTIIALILAVELLNQSLVVEAAPVVKEVVKKELTVTEKILKAFPNNPEMLAVAKCESGTRQYNSKGKVLRGKVDPRDSGLFQISEKYWAKEAKKLGHDIYSTDGNIAMAKHILKVQGIKAWSASSKCWSKYYVV